jgi:hypothetical protein
MTQEAALGTKEAPARGTCTGCGFGYALSAKGLVRKHLSRTGPGECSGSRQKPEPVTESASPEFDELEQEMPHMVECNADYPGPETVQCALTVGHEGMHRDGPHHWPQEESAPPEFGTLAQLHPADTAPVCCEECETGPADDVSVQTTEPDPLMDAFISATGITPKMSAAEQHRAASKVYGCQEKSPCQMCHPTDQFTDPGPVQSTVPSTVQSTDQFTDPGPVQSPTTFEPVGGSPGPGDFDRWGRYLIDGKPHTRSTTFAKIGSNTKAIEQWNCRNVAAGLARRPDLLALAHGMDVKRDRTQLNSIVEQAKEAAGSKVSSNLGTAYHSFTEQLDAGCISLADVPGQYRDRVRQCAEVMGRSGLGTRREWIERTTAVRADQVSAPLPVAGRLDRIAEAPSGDRFIVDLKTGSDLSYGMAEIEVQLAVYAHGVNTHGLYDWNTKTWERLDQPVREDLAIVVHLPADGDGCTLLRVDIGRGWRRAQLRGLLQADQKEKSHVQVLTAGDLAPRVTDPWNAEHMQTARTHFLAADSKERLAALYQFALDSGKYTTAELRMLTSLGKERLSEAGLV